VSVYPKLASEPGASPAKPLLILLSAPASFPRPIRFISFFKNESPDHHHASTSSPGQLNCFDLFPRFLRPGAVSAKGISDRNHLDPYFRVFGYFPDFRVKDFKTVRSV
jgi:hypothetical protein